MWTVKKDDDENDISIVRIYYALLQIGKDLISLNELRTLFEKFLVLYRHQ